MRWYKFSELSILQQADFISSATVGGKNVCIIKHGEKLFVTQKYCPHAGAVLSGGWCEKGKLVCPFHRYEYDLTTGRGAEGQGDYIDIYPVEKRADGFYVGFTKPWWKI